MLLSTNKQSTKADTDENMALAKLEPENFICNHSVLKFLYFKRLSQSVRKDIEEGLINNLQSFLLELGKEFCFVARQILILIRQTDSKIGDRCKIFIVKLHLSCYIMDSKWFSAIHGGLRLFRG